MRYPLTEWDRFVESRAHLTAIAAASAVGREGGTSTCAGSRTSDPDQFATLSCVSIQRIPIHGYHMRKIISNPVMFVAVYLLLMLPTYVLPYMGSNASLLKSMERVVATQQVLSRVPFYLHLGFLFALVLITYVRGQKIDKKWIVIFPVLATFFDLTPGLNLIPLIPTIMHILAVIFGVAGVRSNSTS
jgi:hypothetical protein